MEQAIKIESMFDGRSHHGSFRQHLWHRWRRWLILRRLVCIAMVVIGGFFAIKTYGKGDKFANFITISFILLGSVGYMRPMIWQMWNERKLRKHPAYETMINYTFNVDEVIMDGSSGKVTVPWSEFCEVVETKKGLLLYQNKKDYLWIPGYDFKDGEMTEIVAYKASGSRD
ncbi:MAG: hypothetical protein ACJAR1_000788 [Rubritalea sp.]|jgi:hypothetical protein